MCDNGWNLSITSHSSRCSSYTLSRKHLSFVDLLFWRKTLFLTGIVAAASFLTHDREWLRMWINGLLVCSVLSMMANWHRKYVIQESLLLVSGLGVQSTVTYNSGVDETTYFDSAHTADIIINEGISPCSMFYYLAVIVKDGDHMTKLQPLFTHSSPRLPILQKIYTDIHKHRLPAG